MRARRKSLQEFGPLPNYERCLRFKIEEKVGVIIIHNTTLGPALGGFRVKDYESESEMRADATRLARGMSYKNAASGFKLGGGKAVVNAAPEELTPKFLRKYGEVVEGLGGRYITAPDFGSNVSMMDIISQSTNHVVCLSEENGGLGDPSPSTARGVFLSILSAFPFAFKRKKIEGTTILLQGYGKVGRPLALMLKEAMFTVVVAEIANKERKQARQDGFRLARLATTYQTRADVFVPCATGAVLNPRTIPQLKAAGVKLICGGANNQLAEAKRDIQLLQEALIWYAPDFIANAGGVAIAYTEWEVRTGRIKKEDSAAVVEKRLQKIAKRLSKILQISSGRGITTLAAAEKLAEETVADQGGRLR